MLQTLKHKGFRTVIVSGGHQQSVQPTMAQAPPAVPLEDDADGAS